MNNQLFTNTVKYYALAIKKYLPILAELKDKEQSPEIKKELQHLIDFYLEIASKIKPHNLKINQPNTNIPGEPSELDLNIQPNGIQNLSALTLRMLIDSKKEILKIQELEKKGLITEEKKEKILSLEELIWPLENIFNHGQYLFSKYKENGPLIFPGEKTIKNNIPETPIEIIQKGEGPNIEFKSTLRFDLQSQEINKSLEFCVTKTISAFLNSEGGVLLIGVSDNKEVLGLEPDYQTLSKKNSDGFELHLRQIIKKHLGENFVKNIKISFYLIDGKEICLIHIEPHEKPVFTSFERDERFFIRNGNSTMPLNRKEQSEYEKSHWK